MQVDYPASHATSHFPPGTRESVWQSPTIEDKIGHELMEAIRQCHLQEGQAVSYDEGQGPKGPRAEQARPVLRFMRSTAKTDRVRWVLEWALVWAVFVLHTGYLAPELNEPNYLAKAKSYWDPGWCSQDFFLQTADTHTVFYWSFGWLTIFLPLHVVAVIGRLTICTILAYAWCRLSARIVPRYGFALLSAALVITLNVHCHMAGEWFVGGLEAKGFAYAFVFLGLAALVDNQWNRVWILLGIATALHAVVGGWSVIAAAIAWCALRHDSGRVSIRRQLPGLVVGAVIGLASVWPAYHLSAAVSAEVASRAEQIQVFQRLPHHLNPHAFFFRPASEGLVTWFGIRYLSLLLVWLLLACTGTTSLARRRLVAFSAAAIGIAVSGIVISVVLAAYPAPAAAWLRFYWFRLADVILPVTVALLACDRIAVARARQSPWAKWALPAVVVLVALDLGNVMWHRIAEPVPAADLKLVANEREYQDWRDVCDYARDHTRAESIFLTPKSAHTFKWYAERGEVATWKEMPQDATSLVKWFDRIETIYGRNGRKWVSLSQRPAADLVALGQEFNATYLLTQSDPPIDLERVYRNDTFSIYRLIPQSASASDP